MGRQSTKPSPARRGLEPHPTATTTALFEAAERGLGLVGKQRGVDPEAGQRYVQRIAPAMAESRGGNEEINSQPEAPAGTLRINAPGDAVGCTTFKTWHVP